MRGAWWIATAVVLVGSTVLSTFFLRRKKVQAAQAIAMLVVGYLLVFFALWGMQSSFIRNPGLEIPKPTKRILLSMAGGILAQLLIILDRFVRSALPRNRVSPIYVRSVIGALAGVVGLLIVSARFASIDQVDDPLAILCGVVGGGLGVSILNVARDKVLGSSKR
jgi:hypothetical protein